MSRLPVTRTELTLAPQPKRIPMKLQALVASLALVATQVGWAAGKHDHSPQHGGVVAETKDYDIELVAKATAIQIYLRDHGQRVDLARASAKVTLLTGTDKQEVALKPAGDRLEAAGSFKVGPGTKAVAVVTVGGKASTARFTIK